MNKLIVSILTLVVFSVTAVIGPVPVYAQEFRLPMPGVMVPLSPVLEPPMLKGIKVHPENPFEFDFILDKGESRLDQAQIKKESEKLVKYFLASLTVPEKDLWVNLSPYEKNRIIPQSFGLTEMGRDLLAEDYILKQITASLVYPEGETGRKFWKRVYAEAARKYGTTDIPVNTFNKVWIVPEKAVVYENTKAGTAYIVGSRLKVMLEEDYLAMQKNRDVYFFRSTNSRAEKSRRPYFSNNVNALGSQIVREIVIPELTKEVNEDRNFAQLRQVYDSLILATWYKRKIKDSILEQVYADKNKVRGIEPLVALREKIASPSARNDTEFIYQRYLQAFKKGVYNYIKDEPDPITQQPIPRKYFSGGMLVRIPKIDLAQASQLPPQLDHAEIVTTDLDAWKGMNKPIDHAMSNFERFGPEYEHSLARSDFQSAVGDVIRYMVINENESEFGLTDNKVSPVHEGMPTTVRENRSHHAPFIDVHSHPMHLAVRYSAESSDGDLDYWKDHRYPFGMIIRGQVGAGFYAFVYDLSKLGSIQWSKISYLLETGLVRAYRLNPPYQSLTEDQEFAYIAAHPGLEYQFEEIKSPLLAMQLAHEQDDDLLKRNMKRMQDRWGKIEYEDFKKQSYDELERKTESLGSNDLFTYAAIASEGNAKVNLYSALDRKKVRLQALRLAIEFHDPSKGTSPSGKTLRAIQRVGMALDLIDICLSWQIGFGKGRSAFNGYLNPSTREQILYKLLWRQQRKVDIRDLLSVTRDTFASKYDIPLLEADLRATDSIRALAAKRVDFAAIARVQDLFTREKLQIEHYGPSYHETSPLPFTSAVMEKYGVTEQDIIDYFEAHLVNPGIEEIKNKSIQKIQEHLDSIQRSYLELVSRKKSHTEIVARFNSDLDLDPDTLERLKKQRVTAIDGISPYLWVRLDPKDDIDDNGRVINTAKIEKVKGLVDHETELSILHTQKSYAIHFRKFFYINYEGLSNALRLTDSPMAKEIIQIRTDIKSWRTAEGIVQEEMALNEEGISFRRGRLQNILDKNLKPLLTAMQQGEGFDWESNKESILKSARLFFAAKFLLDNPNYAMNTDVNRSMAEQIYGIFQGLAEKDGRQIPYQDEVVSRITYLSTFQAYLQLIILGAVAGVAYTGFMHSSRTLSMDALYGTTIPLFALNFYNAYLNINPKVLGYYSPLSKRITITRANRKDQKERVKSTSHEMAHAAYMPKQNLFADSYAFLIAVKFGHGTYSNVSFRHIADIDRFLRRVKDSRKQMGFAIANTIFESFPEPLADKERSLADQERLLRRFLQQYYLKKFSKEESIEMALKSTQRDLRESDYSFPMEAGEPSWVRSYGTGIAQLALLHYQNADTALKYIYALGTERDVRQAKLAAPTDKAMGRGGIDFTDNKVPLKMLIDGSEGIKFHLDPAMLKELQNAPGFVPVIVNIQPLKDLKAFLGVTTH